MSLYLLSRLSHPAGICSLYPAFQAYVKVLGSSIELIAVV